MASDLVPSPPALDPATFTDPDPDPAPNVSGAPAPSSPTPARSDPVPDPDLADAPLPPRVAPPPSRPGRKGKDRAQNSLGDTPSVPATPDRQPFPRIDLGSPRETGFAEADEMPEAPRPPDVQAGSAHAGSSPVKLTKAERRVEAMNLRMAGHDYRTIAQELGVSLKTAYYDVQDALTYLAKYERVLAEEVRKLEAQRLDALTSALWDKAMSGDTFAVESMLKIMDRRARLLGLDAPVQVDLAATARPFRELPAEEFNAKVALLLGRIARGGEMKAIGPAAPAAEGDVDDAGLGGSRRAPGSGSVIDVAPVSQID